MSDFAALAQALAVVVQDYTPGFNPAALPPGPVNDSSPINLNFNNLNTELGKIATSIKAVNQAATDLDSRVTSLGGQIRQIGLVVVTGITDKTKIPIPAGFQLSETQFFAMPRCFTGDVENNVTNFDMYAAADGTVYISAYGNSQYNSATGVALSRQGGW